MLFAIPVTGSRPIRRQHHIPSFLVRSLTLACLLPCTQLFDLVGPGNLGFKLIELVEEDWRAIQQAGEESWTQAIGRGCRTAGFEGLIAPSSRNRPRGKNLVYFPDCLGKSSWVRLLAPVDLPPIRRSGQNSMN